MVIYEYMILMSEDRHIDVTITDPDRTVKINLSQSFYSFTANIGTFLQVVYEEENVLVLVFSKGEIRIELTLEELCTKKGNRQD